MLKPYYHLFADNSRHTINTENSLLVELLQPMHTRISKNYKNIMVHVLNIYRRGTGSPLLRQVDPIQQLSFRHLSLYLALSVSEGTFYGDPQQNHFVHVCCRCYEKARPTIYCSLLR